MVEFAKTIANIVIALPDFDWIWLVNLLFSNHNTVFKLKFYSPSEVKFVDFVEHIIANLWI